MNASGTELLRVWLITLRTVLSHFSEIHGCKHSHVCLSMRTRAERWIRNANIPYGLSILKWPLRLSSRLATINLIRFKWVGWPIRHLEFETVTYQRHNNLHRALNCRLIRPEVKNNSRQGVHCSPAHRKTEQDSFTSSESVSKLSRQGHIFTSRSSQHEVLK